MAILPFRIQGRIDVLLVRPSGAQSWGFPSGPRRKGLTQHASAAQEAERQAGVSGRIYKRPLRARGEVGPTVVFPLLVTRQTGIDLGREPASQWFPLQEAVRLVDQPLRPILDDFTRRVGQSRRA